MVNRPNPGYKANSLGEEPIPATIPMWRVQTIGDIDKPEQDYDLFGLVSRPGGFLDSPDTEIMSSGVNTKGIDAVALARHGNFFHWGFGASPTYLTDDAKLVFLNAIHYIAKFDDWTVVARKAGGVILRDKLAGEIRALEAGVSDEDVEKVSRYFSEAAWAKMDKSPAKVAQYLRENSPYFYPVGRYEISVDEELKALGLPNATKDLLWKVISAFRKTSNPAMALPILERYTEMKFDTFEEWVHWIFPRRGRLFFSESAGYKWLVNTQVPRRTGIGDTTPPGGAKAPPPSPATPVGPPPPIDPRPTPSMRTPLVWTISAVKSVGNKQELTVEVQLLKGWHTYDRVPEGSPYTPLELDLQLADGVTLIGEWKRPDSHESAESKGLFEWTGTIQFKATVELDPSKVNDVLLNCDLSYQVCDVQSCRPPTTESNSVFVGTLPK